MKEYLEKIQKAAQAREHKDYQTSIVLCQEIYNDPEAPQHAKVHAHLNAAIAHRLLNQFDQAKIEAQAAKSQNTDPQNQHFILFELASILESAGDWKMAAQVYSDAAASPLAVSDDYGLKDRYLEHAAWSLARSSDPTGLSKLHQAISALEGHLQSPDIAKETGQLDRKYNLQVWLSKAYMHAWELGDKSVEPKLVSLLASNPLLKIRQGQWQELKAKSNLAR